jgi:hypothetical protein
MPWYKKEYLSDLPAEKEGVAEGETKDGDAEKKDDDKTGDDADKKDDGDKKDDADKVSQAGDDEKKDGRCCHGDGLLADLLSCQLVK